MMDGVVVVAMVMMMQVLSQLTNGYIHPPHCFFLVFVVFACENFVCRFNFSEKRKFFGGGENAMSRKASG